MIYTKKATFPYPMLVNNSNDYKNGKFEFDLDLKENSDSYIFYFKDIEISSSFIKALLREKRAQLSVVIKEADSQFHDLDWKSKGISLELPRFGLALNNKTTIQLMIRSLEEIRFYNNKDLNSFYDKYRKDIVVKPGRALAFSNLVSFSGSKKDPLDLFERKYDPKLDSEIKILLGDETIVLYFKNEEFQFADLPYHSSLLNTYIYSALQKVLIRFLYTYGSPEEQVVDLYETGEIRNVLDGKIYQLLLAKGVTNYTLNEIDKIIYLISDNIISKFNDSIRRLHYEH